MASTIITPDHDAVISEIEITAPPERVFQALTDPKQLMVWWSNGGCGAKLFEMDGRTGGAWRFVTSPSEVQDNGITKFLCVGEILTFDPPRVLEYTWIADWHGDKARKTIVRWELVARSGGTLVKVTHSGLAHEDVARKDYGGGWPGVVQELKKFLEQS